MKTKIVTTNRGRYVLIQDESGIELIKVDAR